MVVQDLTPEQKFKQIHPLLWTQDKQADKETQLKNYMEAMLKYLLYLKIPLNNTINKKHCLTITKKQIRLS